MILRIPHFKFNFLGDIQHVNSIFHVQDRVVNVILCHVYAVLGAISLEINNAGFLTFSFVFRKILKHFSIVLFDNPLFKCFFLTVQQSFLVNVQQNGFKRNFFNENVVRCAKKQHHVWVDNVLMKLSLKNILYKLWEMQWVIPYFDFLQLLIKKKWILNKWTVNTQWNIPDSLWWEMTEPPSGNAAMELKMIIALQTNGCL